MKVKLVCQTKDCEEFKEIDWDESAPLPKFLCEDHNEI